jgi:arylsulfatase A-like enzyme
VIIISLDTLRADHLSSYGYRRLTSPNVDALAKGGVRFARTFSTASYTLPSHMSIMTGRFTTEHLVGTPTSPNNRLDSSIPTLAEILKELGYLTVAVTGGNWVSPEWFKRGFYRFRTSESSMFEHLWDLEENLEAVRRVLESRKSERLFLFFHTYKPHTPYMGRFFLLDEGIKVDPKDLLFPYNNIDVARALYDGDIKETDAYVGLLLKLLEEQGILQDALIVLTSDHGEAFEEHGNRTHGSTLFDEELHVPLIFFYPPRVPAGRTVESITSSVDILPTVLELLEVKPVAGLDGTSLRPLWSGGGASVDRAVFIGEANKGKYASAIAIRTPRYKLIGFAGPHNGTLELDRSRSTLYDLESDPGEKVDRLAELPKVSSRLGKALLEAFRTQEVNIATAVEKSDILEISRERRKQLKALGYLQ